MCERQWGLGWAVDLHTQTDLIKAYPARFPLPDMLNCLLAELPQTMNPRNLICWLQLRNRPRS